MRRLTDEQLDALRWLDRFPCTESSYATARGGLARSAATATHFRWKGPRGSILVKFEDAAALREMYQPAAWGSGSLYALTEAGRAVLTPTSPSKDERSSVEGSR